MPDGTLAFTRAGNFHVDFNGNMVDPNGHALEPPIRIPQNTSDIVVNDQGEVFVLANGVTQPQQVGQILLATFLNNGGLKEIGQNLYTETAASNTPVIGNASLNGVGAIRQRALEFSNVNAIEEMMDMIVTQRSFELVVKSIQAGEAMLKAASDLGK
jgi:flagellar basal-body rod protein FlgG